MVEPPIASIVIVNYNGKHFLPACLDSIAAQTLPKESFEVIVSDNGSIDGTLELLKNDYPWVRVIENGENLGFASGNNVAFKEARGKYIVALNNDTAPQPDWLENLVRSAESNPGAGIINGHSRLFYDQLVVQLISDSFIPATLDQRVLGIKVAGVETGAERGVIQYLEGFYGWEDYGGIRYRWSNGQAALGIPIPAGAGDWILTLKLSAPRPAEAPARVSLKVGHEILSEWQVAGDAFQEYSVVMPAATRSLGEPLVQNAGSILSKDGYGQDRGTYSNHSEMFFEIDHGQYPSGPVFTACGANILLRREMLDEIGGFDSRFFMYYEDTDLCWRARLSGWEVYYTQAAIIRHIHCGSSKEWSPFFMYHTTRNRLALLLKNGDSRQVFYNWGRFILGTARNTLGFLKAVLLGNPATQAIWSQLKIRYKVMLSLMIWLPVLVWQRIIIHQKRRVHPTEIAKWLTVFE